MACFKNAGLVFGLMVGFALTAQAARAQNPISELASGVNRVGAEAGLAVTNVLNNVTGKTTAMPVAPSPAPATARPAGVVHHHHHHHHNLHHHHRHHL
jgi:hypothetical protein